MSLCIDCLHTMTPIGSCSVPAYAYKFGSHDKTSQISPLCFSDLREGSYEEREMWPKKEAVVSYMTLYQSKWVLAIRLGSNW